MLQVNRATKLPKLPGNFVPRSGESGEPIQIYGGNLVQGRRNAKWETVEKWGEGKGEGKRAKNLVLYVITGTTRAHGEGIRKCRERVEAM